MKCPNCGNNYCVLETKTAEKRYSLIKGLAGEAFLGAAGFLCGFSDKNETNVKAYWKCKKCEYEFEA